MRRRGAGKCDFAHGGLELRVRANKRDRWGRHTDADGGAANLDASGGEDTLGAARSIGRIRMENGTRDGVGSAAVAGSAGGGGSGAAGGGGGGGGNGGTGPGSGAGGIPRPSNKRTKGSGAVQTSDGAAGNWQGRGRGGIGGSGGGGGTAGGDLRAVGVNGSALHNRSYADSSSRSPPRIPRPRVDVSGEFDPNRGGAFSPGPDGLSGLPREPTGGVRGDGHGCAQALPSRSIGDMSVEFRTPPGIVATHVGVGVRAGADLVGYPGGELLQDGSRGRVERTRSRSPARATGLRGTTFAGIPNSAASGRS